MIFFLLLYLKRMVLPVNKFPERAFDYRFSAPRQRQWRIINGDIRVITNLTSIDRRVV